MKKKSTDDLRQELMSQTDLNAYLSENQEAFISPDVAQLLGELQKRCGLPKAELARRSSMSEVYLHQILAGRRNPSRDRLLCVCAGMGAELEEVQKLLKQAGYVELYPRLRRDAVIIYGILHKQSLVEINDKLFSENEKTLF